MSVKWIRISTSMFDDEKIRLIEKMPEGDSILIIWIKLLSQAGKTNANGYIYLSETIPYTDEMLSTIFNRPLQTVRLALTVFSSFKMIELSENDLIRIENWEKHQNVEGLEKIKEQTRQRVARHREKQKALPESSVTSNVTVTEGNATDIELELDKERDKDKEIIKNIVAYLNEKCGKNFKASGSKTKTLISARLKEGFTLEDFKKVIDNKAAEWAGNEMDKFLRPETLFGPKFEGYLNQKVKINIGQHKKQNGRKEGSYEVDYSKINFDSGTPKDEDLPF